MSGVREIVLHKGRSVGATTAMLENVVGFVLDGMIVDEGRWLQGEAAARLPNVAELAYEQHFASDWPRNDSNPIRDIKRFFDTYCRPRPPAAEAIPYGVIRIAGFDHVLRLGEKRGVDALSFASHPDAATAHWVDETRSQFRSLFADMVLSGELTGLVTEGTK